MKNLFLTILLTMLSSLLFAQVRVIDNFDQEPADTAYWEKEYSENSSQSNIDIIYQSDIVHSGTSAMELDWSAERAESWGGYAKLNHWHPDPNGVYDFSSHDSLSIWYYVKDTSSMGGSVHLRVQLYDVSDSENGADTYTTQEVELYYSFHYVLTKEPGWHEIKMKMNLEDDTQGGGPYWNDLGFTQTGWAGINGNGKLDKDKIKGWGIEFSIDGSNTGEVATGSIVFDDMTLKGLTPKTFVFFNGLSVPSNITVGGMWGGGNWAVEEGAGSDPEGATNALRWTQGTGGWDGLMFDFDQLDLGYTWPIDTLKFKMKADANIGETRVQWEDSLAISNGNNNVFEDGRMGFLFTPINDGQWHEYAFPVAENFVTPFDNTTSFDSTAIRRLHFVAQGTAAGGTMYIDDLWLGTFEADLIAPNPPENVAALAVSYQNIVSWTDVPGEEGESYNVYYGESPITEITDMTEVVAEGIPEGTQSASHDLKYPVSDHDVTYYYAVVCVDAAGNKSILSNNTGAITNTAKGVTTIHLGAPTGFAADGNLDDWAGIAPFRMYVSDGSGSIAPNTTIDGDADLSCDAYVAMDDNFMYLAFDIEDDVISTDPAISTWLRDSPDFFIGLYDWRGASHTSYQRGAQPDYHFRFNRAAGFSDNPAGLGPGTLFVPDSSEDYAWVEGFPTGYTVEAKIPFSKLAEIGEDSVFTPVEGMRIKIDWAINDADLTGSREGLLTYSPQNQDRSWSSVSYWTYTWIGANPTDVEDNVAIPTRFELAQNYPNPFNPSTIIKYSVAKKELVTLKVFNILGQEVKTLVNKNLAPGQYEVKFDASNLATGMYIYQIKAGDFISSKKMMLIK